jgi:hypothetical protein
VEQDWNELKTYWRGKLHNLRVDTPDENFNCMVNTWNAYQCFITFVWSRAASFVYCGLRNGYGYRDTVQDIQGILHLAPEMALGKIRLMVSGQVSSGAGLPLIPYNYRPGHVKLPGEQGYQYDPYRADDALWLFPTIWKYICETGNTSFLDEVIPFADKGEATVYEHLKRAVRFSRMHSGAHGMPAGLSADWNDCLRMGEKGESSFVAFQLYYGMRILKQFAGWEKEDNFAKELSREAAELKETIFRNCWQGDRFIRGIREDGAKVGSKGDPEADFWLNPQSWAVISGCADGAQGRAVLDETEQRLNTEYGAMLLDPPYRDHAFEGARMLLFNASTKENGGIFSQAQGWLIPGGVPAGARRPRIPVLSGVQSRRDERQGGNPRNRAVCARAVYGRFPQPEFRQVACPLADGNSQHRHGRLCGRHSRNSAGPGRHRDLPVRPLHVEEIHHAEDFPRRGSQYRCPESGGGAGRQGGNRTERQKSPRRFHPGERTATVKRRRRYYAEIKILLRMRSRVPDDFLQCPASRVFQLLPISKSVII